MTDIITIKKSVHENSPKMSTRIHQNNVHEKSPQKRNSSGQKCPREFVKSFHENSLILSTRIHLLCPREFFHPRGVGGSVNCYRKMVIWYSTWMSCAKTMKKAVAETVCFKNIIAGITYSGSDQYSSVLYF